MRLAAKTVVQLPDHPLLGALDEDQNERMRASAECFTLDAGELLFRSGEKATRFFVLESGQVKLYRMSRDGHETIIELMRPPTAFAEAVMFLKPRNYPVSCEALAPTRVIGLSMAEFLEILEESRDTTFRLLGDLTRKLHKRVEDVETLSSRNASLRVVNYLLSLAPNESSGAAVIDLPFPKKSVAARLALQPETLSRSFAQLKDIELIHVNGNSIAVPSIALLREHALTGAT